MRRTRNISLTFIDGHTGAGLGCRVERHGRLLAKSDEPCAVQVFDGADFTWVRSGYRRVSIVDGRMRASGELTAAGSRLAMEDTWTVGDDSVRVERSVTVSGTSTGRGFLSAVEWEIPGAGFDDFWFVPGIWYQDNAHAAPYAIGSPRTRASTKHLAFREDRLPLPLVMHWDARTRTAVDVLHADARASTIAADDEERPLVDAGLGFGAFDLSNGRGISFWFPGTEGETIYPPMWSLGRGNSQSESTVNPFAGRDVPPRFEGWNYRYHPLEDGFRQSYVVELTARREESYSAARDGAWRRAAVHYRPAVCVVDLPEVERVCRELLPRLFTRSGGAAGIPTWVDCFTGRPGRLQNTFGIGFVARNLEAADFLLDSGRVQEGAEILDFWTREAGSGLSHTEYDPEARAWVDAGPLAGAGETLVYLRDQSEAHRACLRAWRREKERGRERPEWLAWGRGCGDWLLDNQRRDGAFFRAYGISGRPASDSTADCIHAATFLLELARCTDDDRYARAAERCARYLWDTFHGRGEFFGGTLDNPDCTDKEAAALALEGYLELFEATGRRSWLSRAEAAARVAETWVFLWEIPMPADDPWPRFFPPGCPTTGCQLITSGFSAFDVYLTRHVGDFARLARHTGDVHFRELARILLHNTKASIQLRDEYGYAFPGLQVEHWSMGRGRGYGLNSGWLPWVTTSHLISIEAARREMPEELAAGSR